MRADLVDLDRLVRVDRPKGHHKLPMQIRLSDEAMALYPVTASRPPRSTR